MSEDGRRRVVIESVNPEIDGGRFPIKRVTGEKVSVQADIFVDGHDTVTALLLFRKAGENVWQSTPMALLQNDRWQGEFTVDAIGITEYTLEAWVDHFQTWRKDLKKKVDADQDVSPDLLIGRDQVADAARRTTGTDCKRLEEFAKALTKTTDAASALTAALGEELMVLMSRHVDCTFSTRYEKELAVVVDRKKALFSSWYEIFPRSCSSEAGSHGTFRDCEARLSEIASMGFDVLYFPPIHPIGRTNRKGKNNQPATGPDDEGSPWAIGSDEGGHTAVHPKLGTLKDFEHLVQKAKDLGLEIAMDLAFQCSPDHPYTKEHPEWFRHRPDGTIQYAENPPKKYEDIFPLNFETEQWQALWEELRRVVLFWVNKGIRLFRVDNPHTKPFAFWEWLITGIKRDHPDVLFLAEAFTRPKVMYRLAKAGFSQSYTYFTWRNTKQEFVEYLTELTRTDVWECFRPNFWPNTPDILPEFLQYGERSAFMIRLVLAGTLSSNYGIYGSAYELGVHESGEHGKEEYLNSEKYEIKKWDRNAPGNLSDFIARLNKIRKENPALQSTGNLRFGEIENDQMLFYCKATPDLSNVIMVIVTLDPFQPQSGWVTVPLTELGIDPTQPYLVHDLLGDDKFIWQGKRSYVTLTPSILPARIFEVKRRLRRETDFDYFI
jgi:starch synthase (maltosyl-transferring)